MLDHARRPTRQQSTRLRISNALDGTLAEPYPRCLGDEHPHPATEPPQNLVADHGDYR
jgi:hypothetical protein